MRISIIHCFVIIYSLLKLGELVSATEPASSTFLDNDNNEKAPVEAIAPCAVRLRKVSRNAIPSSSVFTVTLEHLQAVVRRLASIARIDLFDTKASDMGCHAKTLRGVDGSVPVFLFESTTEMNENKDLSSKDNSNNSKSSAQLMNESQMKQIVEGSRVAVYWPNYNKFYEAEVLKVGTGKLYVQYIEDQVTEWVDASHDTFRYVRGTRNAATKQDEDEVRWTQVTTRNFLRSSNSMKSIQNKSTGTDDTI